MAGRIGSLLAQVAALLFFFASVSESTGPRSREIRGASRIPSQFSEEELVTIKEALKGEPSPPRAQMWVSQPPGQPVTVSLCRTARSSG